MLRINHLLLSLSKFLRINIKASLGFLFLVLTHYASYSQEYQLKSIISGYTSLPSFAQFSNLQGIVATKDTNNFVFVTDQLNSIYQFSQNGRFVRQITKSGTQNIGYSQSYIYVVVPNADSIYKYNVHTGLGYGALGGTGTTAGRFKTPYAIASDKAGYLYVTDKGNSRVQKFDPSGKFFGLWGKLGTKDGEFQEPTGIAVDDSGYVYVGDNVNLNVQKFKPDGTFITKWGSPGTGKGQFNSILKIFIDNSGRIYIADNSGTKRIQRFNANGGYIDEWNVTKNFSDFHDFTTNADGDIFVADSSHITRINVNGTVIAKWGSFSNSITPSLTGVLNPNYITLDDSSNIYVTDPSNRQVLKFRPNGTFLKQWGNDNPSFTPTGIAVDKKGNVYVPNQRQFELDKFDRNGTLIKVYRGKTNPLYGPEGVQIDSSENIYIVQGGSKNILVLNQQDSLIKTLGYGAGSGKGNLWYPYNLVMDKKSIYVCDGGDHLIEKFDANGKFIREWGINKPSSANGQFNTPTGIAKDSKGYIYVADQGNNRIQKFDSIGTYINQCSSFNGITFNRPTGIAIDKYDNIYVTDPGNQRIVIFKANPDYAIIGKDLIPSGVATQYTASPVNPIYSYTWSYTGTNQIIIPLDTPTTKINFVATQYTTPGYLVCSIKGPSGAPVATLMKPIKLQTIPEGYSVRDILCSPASNECSGNYINNFGIGTLKNTSSGCSQGAYADYTADTRFQTTLTYGEVYQASLSLVNNIDSTGTNPLTYVGIWIDFNNDGDFDDDQEFLGSSYSTDNDIKLNNLHIPQNLSYTGQARLRVRTSTAGAFSRGDNCVQSGIIGETEDYMVNIKPPVALEAPEAVTPNNDGLNDLFVIRGINPKNSNSLLITDALGNKVAEKTEYNNDWPTTQEATSLHRGTYYYLFTNGSVTLKGFFIINY